MKPRPITDEEWEEFCDFMEEYNKNKEIKKQKFHESFLYSLYTKVNEIIDRDKK